MNDKEKYQGEMEAKLQEWGAKLDGLKAKADEVGEGAKGDIHDKIDALNAKKAELEVKLVELKSSGDDAWQSLTAGFQRAWNELSHSFEDAMSKFSQE